MEGSRSRHLVEKGTFVNASNNFDITLVGKLN